MNEKEIRQSVKWYEAKRIKENNRKQHIFAVQKAVRIGRETICIRLTPEEYEKLREKLREK